jgi:tol-pal system protein YbgF
VEGANALQEYLKRFPEGEQAANAHYWLGEVFMVQWQSDKAKSDLLEKASQEFLNVVNQFPSHVKVSDSVLKLGLIELEKGHTAAARLHLEDVKSRFAGTAAAKVADARLQQLKD